MHATKKLAPLHSSLGTFVAADKVTITPSFGDWQEVEQSWVLDKDYAPLVPSGKMIYYTEGKCSVSLRMTAIFSLCRSGLAPPASRQSLANLSVSVCLAVSAPWPKNVLPIFFFLLFNTEAFAFNGVYGRVLMCW